MSEDDIKRLIAEVSRLSACMSFLKKGVDELRTELKSICNNCGAKKEMENLKQQRFQLKVLWIFISAVFLKLVVGWLG